jgi:integrase
MLQRADVNLSDGMLDICYSKGHDQHYIVLHDSMLRLMRTYDQAIEKLYPDRTYFFPARNGGFHTRNWVQKNFRQLWDAVNRSRATAYELRHHYAIENINRWVDDGFGFDDKLLYLSKSMGHTTIESTRYYYSLVPGMSHLLEKHTEDGFNALIPEVDDEDWE